MSSRFVNPDDILRLALRGATRREIATELNFNYDWICKIARRHGIVICDEPRILQRRSKNMLSPLWAQATDAAVAMFDGGASLTDIATALGLTKGQLSGRLYRLGKFGDRGKLRDSLFWQEKEPERARLAAEGLSERAIARRLGVSHGSVWSRTKTVKKREAKRKREPIRIEFPRHGHCLFAHGDVGDPDFGFCGHRAEPGSSWCLAHHRVVFKPAPPVDMRVAA